MSTETKFTPGPWSATQHPYGAKPWRIHAEAVPYVAGSIALEADARLIGAAPDLYAALNALTAFTHATSTHVEGIALVSNARAALAKANGAT